MRLKHVVTNPYHLWAHQSYAGLMEPVGGMIKGHEKSANHARNGSRNMSFEGLSAYSYSTVVAKIVEGKKGEKIYLLTTHRYSVTTAKHMSDIQQAVHNLGLVFHVPNVTPDHVENMAYFTAQLVEIEGKRQRARINGVYLADEWLRMRSNMIAYADAFGLSKKSIPADASGIADMVAKQAKQLAARNKAERLAQQARDKKRREELAEILDLWLAGDSNVYAYGLRSLPEAYLRVKGDEVQTTQGATVPLEHVQKVMPTVLALINGGREYKRNGHSIHLGHYVLDSISKEGTVKIGCHTIPKTEVLRFAAVLATATATT